MTILHRDDHVEMIWHDDESTNTMRYAASCGTPCRIKRVNSLDKQ